MACDRKLLTEEKGRDRNENRHVERQIQSNFRLWFPVTVVQRVDDVLLVGAVSNICEAACYKVSHECETLLAEVEVVNLSKDERE